MDIKYNFFNNNIFYDKIITGDFMNDILIQYALIILAAILPSIASAKVSSAYNKYAQVENSKKLTGRDVARKILDKNGLQKVTISEISGNLTDHYDPSSKHINLSSRIYSDTSISSLAVAAHECGHAIQDKERYTFLRFRSAMVPVVNFTSRVATIFLAVGIVAQLTGFLTVGIILLSAGLLFQLVTLPVEFNASARAKIQLEEMGLINKADKDGTQKVLHAAALTYVAGFLSTALQIFRLILINRNRN